MRKGYQNKWTPFEKGSWTLFVQKCIICNCPVVIIRVWPHWKLFSSFLSLTNRGFHCRLYLIKTSRTRQAFKNATSSFGYFRKEYVENYWKTWAVSRKCSKNLPMWPGPQPLTHLHSLWFFSNTDPVRIKTLCNACLIIKINTPSAIRRGRYPCLSFRPMYSA